MKSILRDVIKRGVLRDVVSLDNSGKRDVRPAFYLLTPTSGFIFQADEISKVLVP